MIHYLKVLLLIFIKLVCSLASLACLYTFQVVTYCDMLWHIILCVTLWAHWLPASQQQNPQPQTSPGTYLYSFYVNFCIIHSISLGFCYFRGEVKLQIDTNVNVLGIVEVLYFKNNQAHDKKVNQETHTSKVLILTPTDVNTLLWSNPSW